MTVNRSYTVKNPPVLYTLSVCMVYVFCGIGLLYLILTPQFHTGLLACLVLAALPFVLCAIWAKRYSIKVSGTTITLQRSFHLKPCRFDMSDITKAIYIISETRVGINTKLTVYTSSCGKFTVETLMTNSKKLQEQIKASVSKNNIQIVRKSFK